MTEKITTLYWSRAPGRSIDMFSGSEQKSKTGLIIPENAWQGSVRDWYDTLSRLFNRAGDILEKRTECLATEILVNSEMQTVLECLIAYRANYDHLENDRQTIKPMKLSDRKEVKIGTLNNRFNVTKNFNIPMDEVHIKVLSPETMETMDQITVKILDMGIL